MSPIPTGFLVPQSFWCQTSAMMELDFKSIEKKMGNGNLKWEIGIPLLKYFVKKLPRP